MATQHAWVDETLDTPDDWNVDDAVRSELDRLVRLYRQCVWAKGMPRRLGGDATPAQLRTDKKVLRQLAHLYRYLINEWCKEEVEYELPENLEDVPLPVRPAAAQMITSQHLTDQVPEVAARGRMNVTMLHRVNLGKKSNRWVGRYSYEMKNLDRIRKGTEPAEVPVSEGD